MGTLKIAKHYCDIRVRMDAVFLFHAIFDIRFAVMSNVISLLMPQWALLVSGGSKRNNVLLGFFLNTNKRRI